VEGHKLRKTGPYERSLNYAQRVWSSYVQLFVADKPLLARLRVLVIYWQGARYPMQVTAACGFKQRSANKELISILFYERATAHETAVADSRSSKISRKPSRIRRL
jgi:hypothetical protein